MKSIISLAPAVASASSGVFEKSISGFSEGELAGYNNALVSYELVSLIPEASCFGDVLSVTQLTRLGAGDHLCGRKCVPGNNCFGLDSNGCNCNAEDDDDDRSPFLCADQTTLESVCSSLESCYAVNMDAERSNRGFLSGYGCHKDRAAQWKEVTGDLYDTYRKIVTDLNSDDCLLGQGTRSSKVV